VTYDDGLGLPQDFIRAYMWLNVAAIGSKGHDGNTTMKNQDDVASQMTAAQLWEAQETARRCQQSQFKECS
jgi:uncharacterized protein